ncbi:hypothetical protein [Puerhibacterium sp. TATVAM-FAB25]|uniref:hypothetical protein n=1 Tax=Puerhibacterium sp. TATVAM-FAB25 TaxID=3093699 RepID=UPI00397ABEEA
MVRAFVPGVVSLGGIMAAVTATPAVTGGQVLTLSWGTLLALVLGVVAVLLTVRHSGPVLRVVVAHPVRAWCIAMAGIAVVVSPQLVLGGHQALTLPALPVLVAGVLGVLVANAWNLRPAALAGDTVTSPFAVPEEAPRRRGATLVAALTAPFGSAALIALAWWLATR